MLASSATVSSSLTKYCLQIDELRHQIDVQAIEKFDFREELNIILVNEQLPKYQVTVKNIYSINEQLKISFDQHH